MKKNKKKKESIPILLRLELKKILDDFIELYIVPDPIWSKKLNDVYNLYIKFSKEKNKNIEVLKKRAFKVGIEIDIHLKNKN